MKATNNEAEKGRDAAGIVDSRVAMLIATGASMASNNESAFTGAVTSLKAVGASEDEIRLAVQISQTVKEKPAGIMKRLADHSTGTHLMSETPPGGCPAEKLKQTPAYSVIMLISAGSAMAANCEPCLNKAIPELIEVGVGEEDIRRALEIGQSVKDQKADDMKEVADFLGGTNLSERTVADSFEASDCLQECNCA